MRQRRKRSSAFGASVKCFERDFKGKLFQKFSLNTHYKTKTKKRGAAIAPRWVSNAMRPVSQVIVEVELGGVGA